LRSPHRTSYEVFNDGNKKRGREREKGKVRTRILSAFWDAGESNGTESALAIGEGMLSL
jgi:hypothetical protein